MKKLLILCVALLVVPAAAFAQIDMTWDNCVLDDSSVPEPLPQLNKNFNCTANQTYRLHGAFKSPDKIDDFVAMDISIDLRQAAPGPLVNFYHYESTPVVCGTTNNSTGVSFSADKSASGGCALFNTPWGDFGEGTVFAGITAYGPNFGIQGRGRLLAAIARSAVDPVRIEPQKNYFAFFMRFTTNNRALCAGCGTSAAIVWNSAQLYGAAGQQVELIGPSAKQGLCIATMNGATQADCLATGVRNSTWGQLKSFYR